MTSGADRTISAFSINRVAACALVRAAVEAAGQAGVEVAVAVTDASGHLKTFERMDGALFLAVDVAIDKAWTSAASGMATHTWNAVLTNEPKVAPLSQLPRLVGVGGGYPILNEGRVVGGIGVSGGSHIQDQDVAEQALKSLGFVT